MATRAPRWQGYAEEAPTVQLKPGAGGVSWVGWVDHAYDAPPWGYIARAEDRTNRSGGASYVRAGIERVSPSSTLAPLVQYHSVRDLRRTCGLRCGGPNETELTASEGGVP